MDETIHNIVELLVSKEMTALIAFCGLLGIAATIFRFAISSRKYIKKTQDSATKILQKTPAFIQRLLALFKSWWLVCFSATCLVVYLLILPRIVFFTDLVIWVHGSVLVLELIVSPILNLINRILSGIHTKLEMDFELAYAILSYQKITLDIIKNGVDIEKPQVAEALEELSAEVQRLRAKIPQNSTGETT